MAERQHVTLDIDVIAIKTGSQKIGNMDVESNAWIAATNIGGIQFRGSRATDATTAIQALLLVLSNPAVRSASEPDPVVALSMALDNTTIGEVIGGSAPSDSPALPSGSEP